MPLQRHKCEKGMVMKMKNKVSLKLVEKAARGDREAFGELIIMHQEYLYRLAYMYTKNEQDALDAVQECAMRAMISMDKLRKPEYFKTWITRILINSIYLAQKKSRNNSPFEEYSEAAPEPPVSMQIVGLGTYPQYVAKGLVLLAAVGFDNYQKTAKVKKVD